jgi:hypothetical protein
MQGLPIRVCKLRLVMKYWSTTIQNYPYVVLNKDHCLTAKLNPTWGGYWPVCTAVIREKYMLRKADPRVWLCIAYACTANNQCQQSNSWANSTNIVTIYGLKTKIVLNIHVYILIIYKTRHKTKLLRHLYSNNLGKKIRAPPYRGLRRCAANNGHISLGAPSFRVPLKA